MEFKWSSVTCRLVELSQKFSLPVVVQPIEGFYSSETDAEGFSAGDIIAIESEVVLQKVAASFWNSDIRGTSYVAPSKAAGKEILIPLNYQGKLRVRRHITSYAPFSAERQFQTETDLKEFTIKQAIDKFHLPLVVTFIDQDIKRIYTSDLTEGLGNKTTIPLSDTLKLNHLVKQKVLIGHNIPVGGDETEDTAKHIGKQTLVVVPLDDPVVMGIEVNVCQADSTDELYQNIFNDRNMSRDLEILDSCLYVDYASIYGIKRIDKQHFRENTNDHKSPSVHTRFQSIPPPVPPRLRINTLDASDSILSKHRLSQPPPPPASTRVNFALSLDDEEPNTVPLSRKCIPLQQQATQLKDNKSQSLKRNSQLTNFPWKVTHEIIGLFRKKDKYTSLQFSPSLQEIHRERQDDVKTLTRAKSENYDEESTYAELDMEDELNEEISEYETIGVVHEVRKQYAEVLEECVRKRLSLSEKVLSNSIDVNKNVKTFRTLSRDELIERLNICGMGDLAKVCEKENVDGRVLTKLKAEQLKEKPFSLTNFQLLKLERIIVGWIPVK